MTSWRLFYTSLGLFGLSSLVGCATLGGPSGSLPKAVEIRFKGKAGETTETRYFSNSHILSYEAQQLLRDRTEGVDFSVNSHVSKFDEKGKILSFELRTIRKDGTVALHDLAFPELNEEIDYVVRSTGEVLHAGRYLTQSLFYVPAMPIPAGPVEVGDTWTMDHTWLSAKDAIPMKLEVVGILKDIVVCEKVKICADIEISGHVGLVAAPTVAGAHFESRLWGRMLFSIERGDVIWSEMRSDENMTMPGDRMAVTSCMVSETKLGADYKTAFACDPSEQGVGKIPRL